jgi:competence protein ComFC
VPDPKRLLAHLRASWGAILDFLLPAFCELCQSPLRPGERIVCDACWSSVTSPANGGCPRCAAPFTPFEGACPACARTSYAFKGVLVVGPYDGTLGQLIRLMKYRPMPDLARRLGERLGQRVAGTPLVRSTNVVVPVPLHRAKSRERGFCQTTVMAREVARSLEVPLGSSVLRRTKWTRSQTKLSWPERRENVRGAFAQGGGHRPHNQKVLLVDDVFTSGATADEAAKVLLDLGAREVVVAAVARTPPVLGDGGAPPSGTDEGPAQSPAVGTRAGGPPDDGDRNTSVGDPRSIEHRVGPDANA